MITPRAYYNEHDPFAAAWLRELIKADEIMPGDVDERSIEDVVPTELLGYTQCHFFAGIGVWSYALRLAGWPDEWPVWTGSCPCQPFSTAGEGKGFADERHLWPAFHHLIAVCGPERVFGEQVAGKDGLTWLDLVAADVEAMGYACGATAFPAAGIGAPHIRERLYWLADAVRSGQPGPWAMGRSGNSAQGQVGQIHRIVHDDRTGRLADNHSDGREPGREIRPVCAEPNAEHGCDIGRLGHAAGDGRNPRRPEPDGRRATPGRSFGPLAEHCRPGPTNGFWRNADWLGCRDDRWRPVEPGTFPLADGAAARMGRLRGYGNAIVAQQAAAFIESYLEVTADQWGREAAATQERRMG